MLLSKHSLESWKQPGLHSQPLSMFPFIKCLGVAGLTPCSQDRDPCMVLPVPVLMWSRSGAARGYRGMEHISAGHGICAQALRPWSKERREHSLLPQVCLVSQPQAGEIISWDLSVVGAISFSFSLFQMLTTLGVVIYICITVSALLQILYFISSL